MNDLRNRTLKVIQNHTVAVTAAEIRSALGVPRPTTQQLLRVAEIIGVFALEAHAKDDEARRFYEHHGLQRLKDEELHLYLSMKQIKKALS